METHGAGDGAARLVGLGVQRATQGQGTAHAGPEAAATVTGMCDRDGTGRGRRAVPRRASRRRSGPERPSLGHGDNGLARGGERPGALRWFERNWVR